MGRYFTVDWVLEILADTSAVLTNDHFVYTSGRHGSAYINKDAVYVHTDATYSLCHALAHGFRTDRIEIVVAPEVGGVILQFVTAYHLGLTTGKVLGAYAEKERTPEGKLTGRFVFNRGYAELVSGKRVLVVDDILTTGGSVAKVIEAVIAAGGEVVGIGVLVKQGGVTAEALGVKKLVALANVSLESWPEEDCPLCREGRPVNTKVGKGRKFLERKVTTA